MIVGIYIYDIVVDGIILSPLTKMLVRVLRIEKYLVGNYFSLNGPTKFEFELVESVNSGYHMVKSKNKSEEGRKGQLNAENR